RKSSGDGLGGHPGGARTRARPGKPARPRGRCRRRRRNPCAVARRPGGSRLCCDPLVVEAGAVFVAWLGVSMMVLADGRRGLGLGVALAGLGLAAIVFQGHGLVAAAALAVGAAIAAARHLVSGSAGWQIPPPGSTPPPRLCIRPRP